MNENQLRELFKTNEANKTMEATFYETQKSLALIAKQAKYFYDQLILQGFNEGQAMEFMMRTFSANNQQKEWYVMRNYWYVSLTNKYPQPNADDPIRVVQSVQIKKKYSIVEMTREATPNEIDKCKLIYCGHGFFDEPNIQNNINKNLRD